jgi:predicted phage tail protein
MSMTTVKLSGKLGERFGKQHRFALNSHSPREAVRALCTNNPAFQAYLTQA